MDALGIRLALSSRREILRSTDTRVEALLTTVTRDFDRISMHGVRRVLLEHGNGATGASHVDPSKPRIEFHDVRSAWQGESRDHFMSVKIEDREFLVALAGEKRAIAPVRR